MLSTREHHIVDRENVNIRPGKNVATKQPAVKPRRPALGEVGNKLNATKKDPVVKVPQKLAEPARAAPKENLVKKSKTEIPQFRNKSPVQKPKQKTEEADKKCEAVAYSTTQLVDIEDKGNPSLVVEYVEDIYRYLCEMEKKHSIRPNFLENHKSTPRMRAVLVDWLVEAHKDLSYFLETLHLAISLVDRYLQYDQTINRNNLQLVGVTALIVAAKVEEICVADFRDFVYLTDNAFTVLDIVKMERKILTGINWCLGRPLPIHFLKRFSKLARVQPKEYVLGKYLLEIALMQYEMCHLRPSLLAAAATCLSVAILRDLINPSQVWTKQLEMQFSYKYTEFREYVIQLAQFLVKQESSRYQAVRKKYSEERFFKISQNQKLNCTLVKNLVLKNTKKT